MQGQGYYNNQSGYPMAPGYGQPPPQYGAYPGGPVPIQSQPGTVVVQEKVKDSSGDAAAAGCCAGCCAACMAILCCCCMALAVSDGKGGKGGRGRGGRRGRR